ncbi:MAG: RNA-binding protein, partial [Plantibacter flavus]
MLAPALEHLVKGIVDHPDDVRVTAQNSARGEVL